MFFAKRAILLLIAGGFGYSAMAQVADSASVMEDPAPVEVKKDDKKDTKDVKKDDKEDKKALKQGKESVKDNSQSLYQKPKRAWSIGLHGGYPMVVGDLDPDFGLGYGLSLRKALGSAVSIRLNGTMGYATGLTWKPYGWENFQNNRGMNGKNNPSTNYFGSQTDAYLNYKLNFTHVSLEFIYSVNNINFRSDNPRTNLYLFGGLGGFLHETFIDQLDASGAQYNYTIDKLTADAYNNRKDKKKALKEMWDGNYETRGDYNDYDGQYFGKSFNPAFNAGLGFGYRLSERLSLSLEASYTRTGNDMLDGQRWLRPDVMTNQPDGFVYTSLGVNIRLGRKDNVYWFSNPLALPYKTIMDNKKKLAKVDKLEKDMEDMGKRLDTVEQKTNGLTADLDGDGVSDYFDKETNSPAGAIVNGAGETLFFKNDDGDLVYNDPSFQRTKAQSENDFGPDGNLKRSKFDPSDPNGKTIIMKADGKGGLMSPGTNSSAGYLPAIFFESGRSNVSHTYYPELYEIARTLKTNPGIRLHVIGHTDPRSTEAYNQALGMNRAKAVVEVLTTYFGVSPDRLVAESRGELEPLTNARGMDAMAANRRVQFAIDGQSSPTQTKQEGNVEKKEAPKKGQMEERSMELHDDGPVTPETPPASNEEF
jgi:OOP family OmpA-OmpF porin